MIFSSIEFIVFFVVLINLLLISQSNNFKKWLLLGASYYFYGYWDYRFVALMALMTGVNYFVGLRIEFNTDTKNRKTWLIGGVAFNLLILGFFKYFNFFTDSLNALLSGFNIHLPLLSIILPVGISFITFEVISYIADIYQGINKSAKSFWDLALLVAFFPHLVAGPILRSKQFLPEIEKPIRIEWRNISFGIQLFVLGLVRKIIIADRLAMFVDPVFKQPASYSTITLWLAVFAYAIQIYCDFCGYSDMAIGTAKCLGFEVPKNFDVPYIAQSVTEFWRRWHISLSNWLRDYLYIPLGGNQKGKVRQYFNLLIVMLLGGLWHGASWNFVIWGGLHGIGLAIHKIYVDYVRKGREVQSQAYKFFACVATFLFVCLTWVFFRASDFSTSTFIIQKLFCLVDRRGMDWYSTSLLIAIPVLVLTDYAGSRFNQGVRLQLSSFRNLLLLSFVLFGLIFLAPANPSPFIYFQF